MKKIRIKNTSETKSYTVGTKYVLPPDMKRFVEIEAEDREAVRLSRNKNLEVEFVEEIEEVGGAVEEDENNRQLQSLTVPELKKLAQEQSVSNYNYMRKDELIESLSNTS